MCDNIPNHNGSSDKGDASSDSNMSFAYHLHDAIDLNNVECLNEKIEGSARTVFKPYSDRLIKDKYVESDTDAELLFNIPFSGDVKIKNIIVIASEEVSRMKLFKNRLKMSFDDANSEPDQEFEMSHDPEGIVEYSVKQTKFFNASNISIYFTNNNTEDNENNPCKIYYIGLKGDAAQVNHNAIAIPNYEMSPTPAPTDDDDKLSKFKALAVKLKKDLARSRNELQATNEKLDVAEKENSRVTLLYSQQVKNFNSLQTEYDRILDDYETIKKKFRLHTQLKPDEDIKDLKLQLDKKSNTIFDLESKLADIKLQVEQKDQLKAKLKDMTETIQATEKKYHITLRDLELLRSESSKVASDCVSFKNECKQLKEELTTLQLALDTERINHEKLRASFETKVQSLKQQLKSSEDDIHSLNLEFENYKLKVSQLMQDANLVQANSIRTFEQEKLKQLKISNESLKDQISALEQKLLEATSLNKKEIDGKTQELENLVEFKNKASREIIDLEEKLSKIQTENNELKNTVEQFNGLNPQRKTSESATNIVTRVDKIDFDDVNGYAHSSGDQLCNNKESAILENHNELSISSDNPSSSNPDLGLVDDSPDSSNKEILPFKVGRHNEMLYTNGLPFKGTPVEILGGKSSILNDAHVQIDYLTQAYLESEKTNKLLSDQVTALKEEIRRMQRGHERLDLADNLEYLKNIVIKFVSLEGQAEKQRLIPVLSTMLKLSPEEQNKLQSATQSHEKSSFFRII